MLYRRRPEYTPKPPPSDGGPGWRTIALFEMGHQCSTTLFSLRKMDEISFHAAFKLLSRIRFGDEERFVHCFSRLCYLLLVKINVLARCSPS